MRTLVLLLLSGVSAYPQLISLGAKAGVPLTDFVNGADSRTGFNFNTTTNRYLIGPTAELHLPAGFSIEVDALYRHFSFATNNQLVDALTNQRTTASSWEFPVLLKYRIPTPVPLVKPFIDGGVAFNTLTGVKQTATSLFFPGRGNTTSTTNPTQLNENNTMGVVVGAGVEVKALFLRVSPEIRYTRWSNEQFKDPLGFSHSNLNQAEVMVGFTF